MNTIAVIFFFIFCFFLFLLVASTPATRRPTASNQNFRKVVFTGTILSLVLSFIFAPPTEQTIVGKHIKHCPEVIEGNITTPATDMFIVEVEVNGKIREFEVTKTEFDKAENGMDLKELRK